MNSGMSGTSFFSRITSRPKASRGTTLSFFYGDDEGKTKDFDFSHDSILGLLGGGDGDVLSKRDGLYDEPTPEDNLSLLY